MKRIVFFIIIIYSILFFLHIIYVPIHVKKTITINTTTKKLKSQLTDFKEFNTWSPWVKLDPNTIYKYSTSEDTIGTYFTWKGNRKIGSGSQKISHISDNKIIIDIFFENPWKHKATKTFTLDSNNQDSLITLNLLFETKIPFLLNLFSNLNFILNNNYEEGLNSLKIKLEKNSYN